MLRRLRGARRGSAEPAADATRAATEADAAGIEDVELRDAVRTDLLPSAEVMAISLAEVDERPLAAEVAALALAALALAALAVTAVT